MRPSAQFQLADLQASADPRTIRIDRVGVKGLRYPVRVRGAAGEQPTVARIDMCVGLPAQARGIHMSRFIEVLEASTAALDYENIQSLLQQMLARLGADRGEIELAFPYFIRKAAPVSGAQSALDHRVLMRASREPIGGLSIVLGVCVAVTSLRPCSKEISA